MLAKPGDGSENLVKVVCLNWNDYLGRGDEYVRKLRNMVARHLTIPHEFVVVTENQLSRDRAGWWNKLVLLARYGDPDIVLYLDLDVIITANIDELVYLARTDQSKLWMRDDFSYSIVTPKIDPQDSFTKTLGGVGCCNSSVMLWHDPINLLQVNPEKMHGDQNLITKSLWPNGIGLLPNDQILSYKYHWRMTGEVGTINVFHGEPKNHEVVDPWVIKHWQ